MEEVSSGSLGVELSEGFGLEEVGACELGGATLELSRKLAGKSNDAVWVALPVLKLSRYSL